MVKLGAGPLASVTVLAVLVQLVADLELVAAPKSPEAAAVVEGDRLDKKAARRRMWVRTEAVAVVGDQRPAKEVRESTMVVVLWLLLWQQQLATVVVEEVEGVASLRQIEIAADVAKVKLKSTVLCPTSTEVDALVAEAVAPVQRSRMQTVIIAASSNVMQEASSKL